MKTILVSLAVFWRTANSNSIELWFQRRCEDGPLNALLEFPGGKIDVDRGESPLEACLRELEEETGVIKTENEGHYLIGIYPHEYKDRKVVLYAFLFQASLNDEKVLKTKGCWQKFSFNEDYDKTCFPDANDAIIRDLMSHFEKQDARSLELLWPR